MIMNTLYDTGYNLTNLVEELLKIERKISAQQSFLGHVYMNCTILLANKIGTPYIVFNSSEIILIVFY